jgi:hypothetical protein
VLVGSYIRGRATLHSTESFASGLLARIHLVVEIKNQTRPACTAEQQMVLHA